MAMFREEAGTAVRPTEHISSFTQVVPRNAGPRTAQSLIASPRGMAGPILERIPSTASAKTAGPCPNNQDGAGSFPSSGSARAARLYMYRNAAGRSFDVYSGAFVDPIS
jgi:hypothetical protein